MSTITNSTADASIFYTSGTSSWYPAIQTAANAVQRTVKQVIPSRKMDSMVVSVSTQVNKGRRSVKNATIPRNIGNTVVSVSTQVNKGRRAVKSAMIPMNNDNAVMSLSTQVNKGRRSVKQVQIPRNLGNAVASVSNQTNAARRTVKNAMIPRNIGNTLVSATNAARRTMKQIQIPRNIGNLIPRLQSWVTNGTATLSNKTLASPVVTGSVVCGTTTGNVGTSAGTRIVLYPVSTPSTGDFAIGVGGYTMWLNVGPASKYSFNVAGTEVASISPTGAITGSAVSATGAVSCASLTCSGDITGATLGGDFMGRQLTTHGVTFLYVTASTRYDLLSNPFTALGSKILIEADVNYVSSGGITLGSSGVVFTVWTKRNASTYVGSVTSTYGPSSYGGYTSLCLSAVIPVSAGTSGYNLALTVAPTTGLTITGTFGVCRISHFS